MMLADIVTANRQTAGVFFLIAAIVFGLSAILRFLTPASSPERAGYWGWTGFLVDAGLCLTALGLLWS